MEVWALTPDAGVGQAEVGDEVVWTVVFAMQVGDGQGARPSARAHGVHLPQGVPLTPQEAKVLLDAAPQLHAAVHRLVHHDHVLGPARRLQGLPLTQLLPGALGGQALAGLPRLRGPGLRQPYNTQTETS